MSTQFLTMKIFVIQIIRLVQWFFHPARHIGGAKLFSFLIWNCAKYLLNRWSFLIGYMHRKLLTDSAHLVQPNIIHSAIYRDLNHFVQIHFFAVIVVPLRRILHGRNSYYHFSGNSINALNFGRDSITPS